MTYPPDRGVRLLRDWLVHHPFVLPALILLAGAVFRFYGLNWDDGLQLHPDERWIYEVLSGANGNPPLSWPTSLGQALSVHSPLNPHFFAYGSLPFYLLAFLAGTVSIIGQHVPGLSAWSSVDTYGGVPILGRAVSGVLDLGAVLILFLIGRRIFGYWTAVLGMALAAFTVLDIQLSHFFTVDTVLLPLVLLVLLAAVVIAQTGSQRAYVWAGVALGAAMATKTTALLLVVPLGSAAVLQAWSGCPDPEKATWQEWLRRKYIAMAPILNRNLQWLLGSFVLAAFVFILFEPYALIDRHQLVSDIASQTTFLVTNNPPFEVPFTIQYAGTIPYVYQLQNMLFWDLGLPLGLTACLGVIWAIHRAVRTIDPGIAVLVLWVVPYFLFVGRFFAKFSRYMLPITPVMALLGAALLVWLIRKTRPVSLLAWVATALVLGGSFLYSLAYMNIYEHPNTRVAASEWIFTHIPARTTLVEEGAWDDPLPMSVNGHDGSIYPEVNLDLYDADTVAKAQKIASLLAQGKYLVISSQRMDRSIPKLPDRYPLTIRYYNLLFAGRLHYKVVEHFQQHPQLGPFVVHDYSADESFHVYDHPNVWIFKRTSPINPHAMAALLLAGTGLTATATVPPDNRLMLNARQWAADQKAPVYNQMFAPNGFAMQHPILVWLLLLEILGLLAFPLAFLLFGGLMERGAIVAKTMGLLILGFAVWIAVSLNLTTYDRSSIIAATGLFAALSAVLWWRQWHSIRLWIGQEWRPVLAAELVFLAGFALFVVLRMWYPDLGHQFSPVSIHSATGGRMGEKQMELAFLNAIVRSRVFPPFDPYFAGGYINYYYYGFFLVGTLCKLAQIAPATGFNLAIATFFAMLVGNVFTVGSNLTRRIGPGILAAAFVGVLGNLNGGWQVLRGLMDAATVHLDFPVLGGLADAVSGLQQVLVAHAQLPPFDYWESTRIIPPVGAVITEFPYFTYLFADLHPHLMAYPMTAAALALAVSMALRPPASWPLRLMTALLGGLLLGAIAVTNPWDYPTYLAVVALGVLVGTWARHRTVSLELVKAPAAWTAGLAGVSAVLYLPFKVSYQTVFVTGVGLVRNITPQMLEDNGLCPDNSHSCPWLVHDALVTPLSTYLEHFGLFLFIIVSYLALLLVRVVPGPQRLSTWIRFAFYYRDRLPQLWRAFLAARRISPPRTTFDWSLAAGLSVLVVGMIVLRFWLLGFLAGVAGVTALLLLALARRLPVRQLFVLCLILVPLALSVGTQLFFIKDWLAQGPNFRMNTIFKFYNQAWVLYAVAAATTLYYLMARVVPRRWIEGAPVRPVPARLAATGPDVPTVAFMSTAVSLTPPPSAGHPARSALFRPVTLVEKLPVWSFVLGVLLAGSLVYTYAGTVSRETVRSDWLPAGSVPFTLDGMAFMKVAYPGDYGAVNWLNAHVHGVPVIAESANAYYNWRSRISDFTGLPDIFNGIHEGEQRYGDEVATRGGVVDDLYSTSSVSQAWSIIDTYHVKYIVIGMVERQCLPAPDQCFPKAGLAKFKSMVGHGLRVVYSHDGTTLYAVTR